MNSSLTFNNPLLFVFLCIVLVLMSMERLRRARQAIFLLASLAFVGLYFKSSPRSALFLAVSLAIHYAVLRAMLATASERLRQSLYYAWLVAAVAAFVIVKQYEWLTGSLVANMLAAGMETIGLSYIIFRQIHLGIEVRDGMLDRIGLLEYLAYLLAYWTFTAGPVQRFEPFREEFRGLGTAEAAPPDRTVLLSLNRVMWGYFKMFVLATYFFQFAKIETFTKHPDAAHLGLLLLAYPIYIYLNFSGYCDIVIGLARAVGFTLSENFNRPYVARNMVDYWNRWHMTVSTFFRDYMYFPIYTSLCRRGMPPLGAAIPATLASFFVMGAWHGNTFSLAVFGVIHGLGVIAVNVYSELLRKVLSRDGLKRYKQSRLVHAAAWLVCQGYVVLAYLPFAYPWSEVAELYRCVLQWASY
jgi:D-alanyl-lipoteichoic acid acyltransferase DltB (MBOAT superfamily)